MNGVRRDVQLHHGTCQAFIRSPSPTRTAVSAFAAKKSSQPAAAMYHHRRFLLRRRVQRALHALVAGNTYEWSTGERPTGITVDMPGIYSVTAPTRTAVSAFAAKRSSSNPLPQCTITGRLLLCEGESSELCTPWLQATLMNGAPARRPTASQLTCPGIYSGHGHRPERLFQRLRRRGHLNPLPQMYHHRRLLLARANPASFARPWWQATPGEWSTGETSNCITVTCRAFIPSPSPT